MTAMPTGRQCAYDCRHYGANDAAAQRKLMRLLSANFDAANLGAIIMAFQLLPITALPGPITC
jgi:hypothetical protein